MSRTAVTDLARELGMRSSDLLFLADEAGVHIARVCATLTRPETDRIRAFARTMEVSRQGERRVLRPRTRPTLTQTAYDGGRRLTHTLGSHIPEKQAEGDG